MINKHHQTDKGNKIATKMFYFLIISLIPMFSIIIIYIHNPTSNILNYIALRANDLPAIYSQNTPVFSKTLSLYVKTAPFTAILLFLNTCKNLRLKNDKSPWQLLKINILFTFFYAILIYAFLFTDTELTSSAKMLKLMSVNIILLSFFYISLHSIIFIFSYLYFWFCIGSYRSFKEK
ncbi:colicin immunity protein Cui [Escherichia coli]|nr:colicin immunity protein Cui [Escherichia coli]EIH24236.1 colicin immunity protein [Escherichia coli 1.2264]EEQ3507258.1 colicin immunity protein Cui [Escherichia coli]EEQ4762593.1 colicin immunity protein Cui [Escherichia coli]EET0132087.1 colicin immunity protein Cui [Escherichia coli]